MLNKLEMFKRGVHFGHKPRYWNPLTAPYVFGKHPDLDLHIIDLDKTLICFDQALQFIRKTAQSRGNVLFVGTKRNAQELVKTYAEHLDMPYVTSRWLGGMLTNFKTIKRSVDVLKSMEEQFEAQNFTGYTKKERLTFERRLAKLRANLSGIKNMRALPDAIFVIDVKHEAIAINEANKLGIPVIGVVDTNSSPEGVQYVVPGNDDAVSAIHYYVKNVATIIKIEQDKIKAVDAQEKAAKEASSPKIVKVKKEEAAAGKSEVASEATEEKPAKKTVKRVVKAKAAEDTADDVEKPAAKTATAKKKPAAAEKTATAVKKAPAKKKPAAAEKTATDAKAKAPAKKKPAAKKTTAKSTDAKES